MKNQRIKLHLKLADGRISIKKGETICLDQIYNIVNLRKMTGKTDRPIKGKFNMNLKSNI